METLPPRTVHVWYTLAPRELEADVSARFRDLLLPHERARHERFVQEKDRCQYLLGKVLVRSVLSRYHPRPPQSWTFATTAHGKPVLAEPPDERLCFNLSHTEGLVACAVSGAGEVGIDVENRRRAVTMDLARRYFAPPEVAFLEGTPAERQQHVFFRFWTLKEAYVKACGLGLSLPLEQFAFRLADDQAPRIAFTPELNDDPEGWQFFLPDVPSEHHQMAVAVQCHAPVELVLREMTLG